MFCQLLKEKRLNYTTNLEIIWKEVDNSTPSQQYQRNIQKFLIIMSSKDKFPLGIDNSVEKDPKKPKAVKIEKGKQENKKGRKKKT